MATFVDRLILKNSTDNESTILNDISFNGQYTIKPGELVVGIQPNAEALYTVNSRLEPVSIKGYRPESDIYYNYTDLILNADDGAFDKSVNNITGNSATFLSTAQVKYGPYSYRLPGTDVVRPYSPTGLLDPKSTFTAETWVRFDSLSTKQGVFGYGGTNAIIVYGVYYDPATSELVGEINTSTGTFYVYNNAVAQANTWYHIALVRTDTYLTLYVDGIAGTPVAVSGTFPSTSGTTYYYFVLGAARRYQTNSNTTPYLYMTGYADGFRLTNDIARYRRDFTPPQQPNGIDYGDQDQVNLSLLSDVTITSPSNGQVLVYNGIRWVNSSTPINSIDEIPDVTITTPSYGDYLIYDGNFWINKPINSGWFTAGDGGNFNTGSVTTEGNYSLNGGLFV